VASQGRAGEALKRPLMRLNEKPRRGPGLDGAGGWLYSRVAVRGVVTITEVEIGCQISPTSLLGNSGRVSNAQRTLNPHRGGQPVGARRVVGKRKWHRETGKSSRQRMAPSVINSARSALGVLRLLAVRIHHQSSTTER
jgi:hypothetical protein